MFNPAITNIFSPQPTTFFRPVCLVLSGSVLHSRRSGSAIADSRDTALRAYQQRDFATAFEIDASKERDKLADKMTPVQIAEAQRLAKEWMPTPPQEQAQHGDHIGNTSAPVVLYKVDPDYSEKARKKKLAGTVVLRLIVD